MFGREATKSTHYSYALSPKHMKKWAKEEAKWIVNTLNRRARKPFPVLVFSGMSGTNHAAYLASALSDLKLDFGQMYVRKPGERSHGNSVAEVTDNLFDYETTSKRQRTYTIIFVDDFISEGNTLKRCVQVVLNRVKESELQLENLVIAITMDTERFRRILGIKTFNKWKDITHLYK